MSRDHGRYYAAEVEEHYRDQHGLTLYTTGALVVAGLVGLGISWLIYDRVMTRNEQVRRHKARIENKANARRALEMKKRSLKPRYPESEASNEGVRNTSTSI